MQNPFSWGYLTAPVNKTPVWGPFSITFVVLFGLGLLVALALYFDLGRRLRGNRMLYRAVQRGSGIAMTIFAVGLVFFAFRYLRISALGLHMRLWIYLCFLAAVMMTGYFVYYMRIVYPAKIRALEAARLKKKYLAPMAQSSAGGSRGHRRRARKRKRTQTGTRA